jgi:hypothetical protein
LFCINPKTKFNLLNYNQLNFHKFLLIIKWLLYYFAYGESESSVCCVLFIKVTSNLCTLCFVVLGSTIMGVSITTMFIMGNIHIKHLLALQLCCLLNAMLFCCILMDSNWDGVGFVRMKEK